MSSCIFIGPSLAADDAIALYPRARFLPPVQQGSIYEAIQRWSPNIIGVIDGYFQHCPSVWHKEILWALNQGVHVIGASSMGALRAAELEAFGMVGVGAVFETFQAGAMPPFKGINDDDEVAVTHAPAESGYIAVSDAMINIRFTLNAARSASVIDNQTAAVLIEEAKSLHFSERTYSRIIDRARSREVHIETLDKLTAWLPTGKIDQKRKDAIALIEHVAHLDNEPLSPYVAQFHFEVTEIFHDALLATQIDQHASSDQAARYRAVLDELRLDENAYHDTRTEALARHVVTDCQPLTGEGDNQQPVTILDDQIRQTADTFRLANGLLDRESIDQWLDANDLDIADFDDFIRNETQYNVNLLLFDAPSHTFALIHGLRMKGTYAALSRRACAKQKLLALQSQPILPPRQLLRWYFETLRGETVPADIVAYARRLGLTGKADLLALLSREYHYLALRAVDISADSGDG